MEQNSNKVSKTTKRPAILSGETHKIEVACSTLYVTINTYNDEPFEIFVTLGKAGSCIGGLTCLIGRLISIALRSGTSIHEIYEQLNGSSCPQSSSSPPIAISCPQGVANAIRSFLDERDKLPGN